MPGSPIAVAIPFEGGAAPAGASTSPGASPSSTGIKSDPDVRTDAQKKLADILAKQREIFRSLDGEPQAARLSTVTGEGGKLETAASLSRVQPGIKHVDWLAQAYGNGAEVKPTTAEKEKIGKELYRAVRINDAGLQRQLLEHINHYTAAERDEVAQSFFASKSFDERNEKTSPFARIPAEALTDEKKLEWTFAALKKFIDPASADKTLKAPLDYEGMAKEAHALLIEPEDKLSKEAKLKGLTPILERLKLDVDYDRFKSEYRSKFTRDFDADLKELVPDAVERRQALQMGLGLKLELVEVLSGTHKYTAISFLEKNSRALAEMEASKNPLLRADGKSLSDLVESSTAFSSSPADVAAAKYLLQTGATPWTMARAVAGHPDQIFSFAGSSPAEIRVVRDLVAIGAGDPDYLYHDVYKFYTKQLTTLSDAEKTAGKALIEVTSKLNEMDEKFLAKTDLPGTDEIEQYENLKGREALLLQQVEKEKAEQEYAKELRIAALGVVLKPEAIEVQAKINSMIADAAKAGNSIDPSKINPFPDSYAYDKEAVRAAMGPDFEKFVADVKEKHGHEVAVHVQSVIDGIDLTLSEIIAEKINNLANIEEDKRDEEVNLLVSQLTQKSVATNMAAIDERRKSLGLPSLTQVIESKKETLRGLGNNYYQRLGLAVRGVDLKGITWYVENNLNDIVGDLKDKSKTDEEARHSFNLNWDTVLSYRPETADLVRELLPQQYQIMYGMTLRERVNSSDEARVLSGVVEDHLMSSAAWEAAQEIAHAKVALAARTQENVNGFIRTLKEKLAIDDASQVVAFYDRKKVGFLEDVINENIVGDESKAELIALVQSKRAK